MSTFVASSHLCLVILIFIRFVSPQQVGSSCGANPSNTFCWYNEMDLSSPSSTSFTQNVFTELTGTLYLYTYFTPKYNDCLSPSLTVSYEMIDNDDGNEGLIVYDPNEKRLIACYNGKSCGSWYTCLNSYALGYVKWVKDNSYYIKIKKEHYIEAECGHTLTVNAHITINCAQPPSPSPSPSPTPSPTSIPTPSPSSNPTASPTPQYFAMDLLHHLICNDFSSSTETLVYVSESTCFQHCQSLDIEQCRMVNYLDNFKSADDSRCLIYNRPCSLSVSDTFTNSRISYKVYGNECTSYPSNWIDAVGDDCQSYVDYGWCSNGVISNARNANDFVPLQKHGVTALNACCECGGGIKVINDDIGFVAEPFASRYDDVIDNALCSLDNMDAHRQNIRNWDIFIAYQLCEEIYANNNSAHCSPLIDSQYIALTKTYVQFCDVNDSTVIQEDDLYFMMVFTADTSDNYIYINSEWFDIDSFDFSPNTIVDTMDYSQCLTNLKITNNKLMGAYPCYFKYTEPSEPPTLAPTDAPTKQPSFAPTSKPTRSPTYSPTTYGPTKRSFDADTAKDAFQFISALIIAIFNVMNI